MNLNLSERILTRSVPRSIHRMVMVPSGSGTSAMMNSKNGEISGMLEVRVYAIDFCTNYTIYIYSLNCYIITL